MNLRTHLASCILLCSGVLLGADHAATAATLSLGTITPTQVSGDGDAVIEPGETWQVSVQLQNSGTDTASSINATVLSLQTGVTVTQATSTYPAIGPSGNAVNATLFSFNTAGIACGQPVLLRLKVRYTDSVGSGRAELDFALPTGALTAVSNYSYLGAPVAIPDGSKAGTSAYLSVSGAPTAVGKATFSIDGTSCTTTAGATTVGVDHTYAADIDLELRSPAGTTVRLLSGAGGDGNNFCQVVLDDASAGASIQTAINSQAPFTGSWKPQGLLATLGGENPNGIWELIAHDPFAGDSGSIRAFSLHLAGAQCNFPAGALLYAEQSVASRAMAGDAVALRIVLRNRGGSNQADNPGDEFTETLPAQLTLTGASATTGLVTTGGNTVHWNGAIAAGANVTLLVQATINAGTAGQTVSLQGTSNFDANGDATNESSSPSDNVATRLGADANTFPVLSGGPFAVTVNYFDRTLHLIDLGVNPPTVSGPFFDHDELGAIGETLDVATAPDGSYALISNFSQQRVYKVDLSSPGHPAVAGSLDLPIAPEDIAFAPNGSFAVISDGGAASHLDFVKLPELKLLGDYAFTTPSAGAQCATVAPDNQTIVACDNANSRLIVGVVNAQHTALSSESAVAVGIAPFNVAFAPDGQTLLVGTFASTIPVFNLTGPGVLSPGVTPSVAGLPGGQQSFSFSPAGNLAYTISVSPSPDKISVLNVVAPGNVTLNTASAASVGSDSASYMLYGVDTLATAPNGTLLLAGNSGGFSAANLLTNNLSLVATSGFASTSAATASDFPVGVATFSFSPGGAACVAGQGGLCLHTILPCRVFDSRLGGGPPLASGTSYRVAIAGDKCGIPREARAISFNVTITGPNGPGNLAVFPDRGPAPTPRTLNFVTNQTRGNNVVMALETNADGALQLLPQVTAPAGSVHVIIDINGYFSE